MRRLRYAACAVLVAAALAGTAWFLGRYAGGVTGLWDVASRPTLGDWALILAATVVFYLLDWLRFQSLLAIFGISLSPWRGFRLTCTSYFVSSLTPSSELHPPVTAYFLMREGVPGPVAVAVTAAKSLYMVLWIGLLTVVSLYGQSRIHLPPAFVAKLPWLIAPLAVITFFLALLSFFPKRVFEFCRAHDNAAARGLGGFIEAISRIGTSTDRNHLVCHTASAAFVFVYAFMGWSLCRAVGVPLDPRHALAVFSASLLVAYLAPVPGSVGVTEAATAYLIDPSMPPAAVAAAFLLRTLAWYIVLPPGAVLVALEVQKRGVDALLGPLGTK